MSKYVDVITRIVADWQQDQVRPDWVATAALKELDPTGATPYDVQYPALMELKQTARRVLRGKFESEDGSIDQHELFPTLQRMYPTPTARGENPVYLKLELLTQDQALWNVNRLRREAKTKQKHADALEQYAYEHLAAVAMAA